ncbi:hypothetical protein VPH35_013826 [Triticum aestivum]
MWEQVRELEGGDSFLSSSHPSPSRGIHFAPFPILLFVSCAWRRRRLPESYKKRETHWTRRRTGMSGRPATSSTSLFFIADSCPGFATRMLCPVCFSHCVSDNDTTFGMFFRDPNERLVLLPCSMTERFPKHFAGDFLNFRAHGHRYIVYVYTASVSVAMTCRSS